MTQAVVAETWHRVGLEGTKWSVWRDVGLRGAGFSADTVLAICDSPLASSADRDGRGPVFDAVFADATMRLSTAIAAVNADPAFQEALTWQNPGLVQFLHDHDISQGAARRSKDRKRELVVASYVQRYCLKNDTIGFFGPVGWASVGRGEPGLVVVPGERLIARRTTYFEVWAIDKVAAAVAGPGRVLGWLRPRRTRSVFVAGNVLHRPHRHSVTLTDADASEADFTAANLDVAVAYRIGLRGAVLRDASAFATILEGADLSDADLSGFRFLGPMANIKAPRAKFVKANLGVDPGNQSMGLMRVDATGADFSGADFTGASLRKALLVRATFTGATLTDADVTYADLAGALLKDIRGRDRIRGLDQALHVDQALFHD